MGHRRVVAGGEHEAEADLVDAAGDRLGAEIDVHPQGLEQIGRAASARVGAVAMLGDRAAGTRGDQRRRSGDVEGRGAAAGSGGVDQLGPLGADLGGERPHRPRQADQLGHRLPLGAKGDQEGAGLDRVGAPLHDLGQHRGGVVGGEVVAAADRVDRAGDDVVGHQPAPRKLASRCLPCGVSTDSG